MGSVHQPDFRVAAGFVDTETFALFAVKRTWLRT
jgi:hypothetical protein